MWWEIEVLLTLVAHWHWGQILVWVEGPKASRESSQISEVGDLDHTGGLWCRELWLWWGASTLEVAGSVVVIASSLVVVLHLLWHWRKSHALWEIGEWVNELSSLFLSMVEGATFAELALSILEEVFAWLGFVVGVDSAESSLAEVFGEWLYSKDESKVKNLRHLVV